MLLSQPAAEKYLSEFGKSIKYEAFLETKFKKNVCLCRYPIVYANFYAPIKKINQFQRVIAWNTHFHTVM